jgi:hypothetical protein
MRIVSNTSPLIGLAYQDFLKTNQTRSTKQPDQPKRKVSVFNNGAFAPDTATRVRYLFHLFFPTPENLRWRYGLSGKSLIMPYYLLHLFVTSKKIFLGFWHKLSFHSQ